MNKFEYAQFLRAKDKHSREHQQLLRDSKLCNLDLDKYKSKNSTRLELKDYMLDLKWDELRATVDKKHREGKCEN